MSDPTSEEIEKINKSLDELEDQIYTAVDDLSPKQQKFAMWQVTTNMDGMEAARRLGISDYMRKKWQKDEDIKRYKKYLQSKLEDSNYLEAQKRQNRWLRKQMFQELVNRFRGLDEAIDEEFDEDEVPTESEINEIKNTLAKYADFDKFMKIWKDVNKETRLDEGEATERVDENSFQYRIQENFEEYQKKRKQTKVGSEVEVEPGESLDEWVEKVEAKSDKDVQDADFEEVGETEQKETKSSSAESDEDFNLSEYEI